MNWAGLSVTVGLAFVGFLTLPWGLAILAGLAVVGWWSRPR